MDSLADLLHFDCTRLSKLGVCTPYQARRLEEEIEILRRVVTSEERRSGTARSQGFFLTQARSDAVADCHCGHGRCGHCVECGERCDGPMDGAPACTHCGGRCRRCGCPGGSCRLSRWMGDPGQDNDTSDRKHGLMPGWLFRILCDDGRAVRSDYTICEHGLVKYTCEVCGGGDGGRAWEARPEDDPGALREARSRIEEILQDTEVKFNGAAEAGLPSVAQAWSIDHTDDAVAAENREIIAALAEVLCDYPALRFEVHGETGLVQSAPEALASLLGLHPVNDVVAIMDELARRRAQACLDALVEYGVPRAQLLVTSQGQGGGVKVEFIPTGSLKPPKRFGHVPLRFVHVSELDNEGWRGLHLALNCHLDPLPTRTARTPRRAATARRRSATTPRGAACAAGRGSAPTSPSRARAFRRSTLAAVSIAGLGVGGGPRGAYETDLRSAFFSSTRTPNPHVGDAQIGPLAFKTSLVWREVGRHAARGVLLWADACCLDQAAISKGAVDVTRYAEGVLAALEESEMLWVYATSDYSSSLFTVLELLTWHAWKGVHPGNTTLLNAMVLKNVAGAAVRVPLYDPTRDHPSGYASSSRSRAISHRAEFSARTPAWTCATAPRSRRLPRPERRGRRARSTTKAAGRRRRAAPAGLRREGPQESDWDYGWINPPAHRKPAPGRPPASEWIRPHEDYYYAAMGTSRAHLKPGLVTYAEGAVGAGRRAPAGGD